MIIKFNEKRILSLIAFTSIIVVIYSNNNCKIKMSRTRTAFGKSNERLIFNEGIIEMEEFKENSYYPYTTPAENKLEYFYIFESKAADHNNHDKIKTLVTSSDSSILTVKSEPSNSNSEFHQSFDMNEIEVTFTCIENKTGRVKVSMLVTSDQCDPFTISWVKECKLEFSVPSINIGVTPNGGEVMQNGKFSDIIKASSLDAKYLINKDTPTLNLFFSSNTQMRYLYMREPEAIFNEENIITIFKGDLQKGGVVQNSPQILTLAMACKDIKKSTTDIQIKLYFDNQNINLFFYKECDTTGEVYEYFSIVRSVYWILISLIVVFIIVVIVYYLKANDLTIYEAIEKVKEYIDSRLFGKDRLTTGNRDQEGHELTPTNNTRNEKLYDDDNIDFKISSSKEDNTTKHNYGGI